jgi:hypothetical protein
MLLYTYIIYFMWNNVMHFELCKLMVYKPNYVLLPRSAKPGVLYHAIYHTVTSTFGVSWADSRCRHHQGAISVDGMLSMEEIGHL